MNETVVMKFGGTSVGSTDRISAVAARVAKHIKDTGDRVVVVVSAMGKETDRLVELARKISGDTPPKREYHQLVTAGEHASSALAAMAMQREGIKSKSLLAHQLRLTTKEVYGQNLIESIDADFLNNLLDEGFVPIVAGFQGIDSQTADYTTLGRGGSDTTAVALAAALDSCKCYICTDVDGVYTALPSVCRSAKKLDNLTYEEMLELASSGATVLQTRSVSLARKHKVPLIVCSSFEEKEGTIIVEEYKGMEDSVVSGITFRTDEAKLTLRNLPDSPGVAAKIFQTLGNAQVVVDMIVQSEGAGGKAVISFTVPSDEAKASQEALNKLIKAEMPDTTVEVDENIAKLSVVGEGMRTHAGIASQMFDVLGRENINVDMISTSEIKISIVIDPRYAELAVRVLHEHFLDK